MAYGYFKGLARRTAFGKIFRNKTFNIVKIQNIMDNTNQLSENLRKEKYSCFLHIISRQSMRNLENIGHIVLETVR